MVDGVAWKDLDGEGGFEKDAPPPTPRFEMTTWVGALCHLLTVGGAMGGLDDGCYCCCLTGGNLCEETEMLLESSCALQPTLKGRLIGTLACGCCGEEGSGVHQIQQKFGKILPVVVVADAGECWLM
mmetsp:Transcript_61169/g.71169  ORF Transcript_61169/g.71169 Transcript_61169/m.71169 type:complete len:127 (+) Transcript_61169:638-1018(+)